MLDVLTIGDALISMYPRKKGPLRFSHSFERGMGGAELNFAIGCARLGLKPGWISKLGDDEFGKYVFDQARGEGVDLSHVTFTSNYPTSVYFREIHANGDSRSFFYRHDSPTLELSQHDIVEEYVKNFKILHITGVFPSIHHQNIELMKFIISIAKKHGLKISFDPNVRLKMWSAEEAVAFVLSILKDVDIILTSKEEADLIFGLQSERNHIEAFKKYGIETVVIKKGADGAVGEHNGEYLEQPAVHVPLVVDTVGAGDGFDAGFISAHIKGKTFKECLEYGSIVGAMVVSVEGDNEGLPTLDQVRCAMGEYNYVER
ncbi:sugar kinase [Priestia flexa]|uniref:sugar kinase n=1 Tax=Priestia flexa TaxID=86664 RepID=UPI003D2A0BC7